MVKILDLTNNHSGKWYEVLYFVKKNDYDDKGVIVAKFLEKNEAKEYAERYVQNHAGFEEVVVR